MVTTQPASTVSAGAAFGLAVSAEDGLGNVDTSFSGSVTVSSVDGNALGGTLTVAAVNGVATFSGLTETKAGSDAMFATATGLPFVQSASFTVTPGLATKLVILGPGNVGLSPFGLSILADDSFGNVDTTFTGNVTVALAANPGGATLGGSLTVAAVNGDASFGNLTVNKLANGYTLMATSTGLASAVSASFDVVDQVIVTTPPPSTITAGAPFGLTVTVLDTSYDGNVSLSLSNYTGGNGIFTLNGTVTQPAVSGVATFSGLTLDQAGPFGLVVSGPGLAGTSTGLITVTAGAASQLAVTAQPSVGTAGAPFEVDVSGEDTFGNVDTTFTGSTTLALANNPAGGTLDGTTTVAAFNGVAAFPGLTINNPGSGYTLQATSSGLTQATTNGINVTPPGVANQLVVATQPPASVTAGSGFGLVLKAEDNLELLTAPSTAA